MNVRAAHNAICSQEELPPFLFSPTDGPNMIDTGVRDITSRLRVLLHDSPMAELRKLRVRQDGDRILLAGCVKTYYAKQMAQETIRGATRGLHIVNEVLVEPVGS